MSRHPPTSVIALLLMALGAAALAAALLAPDANWDLGLLAVLLALSAAGDLWAVETAAYKVKISGSFLVIVVAAVLLGATPASVIGVLTILAGTARWRTPADYLLINLVTYAVFPLVGGIAFHDTLDALGASSTDPVFYLLVLGAFLLALSVNFTLVASYTAYRERGRFVTRVRRALLPVLPSELAAALLAIGFTYLYFRAGLAAIALLGLVLLTFQRLLGELLLSQQRADELELRARQLAGFQVTLLAALIRILDLRDQMTARHSAAVARYAREIAAAAGLSEEGQELAHTAGLLHDIGKFALPDRLLRRDVELTEEDRRLIRTHPYEGARIVSQVDGYAPVGEAILAHHERIDGGGYPRGLQGEEIPEMARIVAVAETYDALTARDSYRRPISSFEALAELRNVAGRQLDTRFVEALADVLAGRDLDYRHGEDADFDTELALERRIHDQVEPERSRRRRRRALRIGSGRIPAGA